MADQTTANQNQNPTLTMSQQIPNQYKPGLENVKQKVDFFSRLTDSGFVGKNNGESFLIRDGANSAASSPQSSSKTIGNNEQNQSVRTSFEEHIITNRFRVDTDDVVINSHKLNPAFWELTDFKQYTDPWGEVHQVGGFCTLGTVLTRTWDHQLNKYVLIRRLARIPMFSVQLNTPEVEAALSVQDPSKKIQDYPVKQSTESVEDWYKRVEAAAKSKANDKSKTDEAKSGKDTSASSSTKSASNNTTSGTSQQKSKNSNSTNDSNDTSSNENSSDTGVSTPDNPQPMSTEELASKIQEQQNEIEELKKKATRGNSEQIMKEILEKQNIILQYQNELKSQQDNGDENE